jgi:hypothetical protein
VIWTGYIEKFLDMVLGRPCLVLESEFGGCDILLAGVIGFLVVIVVASCDGDVPGVPLLPLLAAMPSSLGSGLMWCCSATVGGCFCIAQDESGLNHLLTRGLSGGDVE